MGSNKFNRALGHLKSTSIDERIRQLDEQPTNNTSQIYIDQPDRTTTTELNTNLNPLDLTQDALSTGRDTTGLFMSDGTILAEEPPGDTSYVLGPMAAMYYTWSYPWTMIGYIRQSDRKMVNLGRIDGKLSDWNGTAGDASSGSGTFNSYGQLTLEQAAWFRDIKKQSGASNDPSTYNYYAFYPGPPSQTPDQYGRYPCVITGLPKRRTDTSSDPATDHARGLDADWGLPGLPNLSPDERKRRNDRLRNLMGRDPSTLTDTERQELMDAGLDDFVQGGMEGTDLMGDLATLALSAATVYTLGQALSALGPAALAKARGLLKGAKNWWNKGRNTRIPDENNANWRDLMRDDLAQRGQSDAAFKAGKNPNPFGRPDQAFNPFRPASKGGPGSGPTPAVRQVFERPIKSIMNLFQSYEPNGNLITESKDGLDDLIDAMDKALTEVETVGEFNAILDAADKSIQSRQKKSVNNNHNHKRKKMFREIKSGVVLPEEKKEKLQGYRPKFKGALNEYDKLMQKAENPASFKQMDETTWTKQDKYFNARLSQERKNEVLDHLGTGDHFWEILTETGRKRGEKGLKEKYGDFTLVRKEQMVGDTLLFLVDENGKKETILQSEYSDRIARQHEEHLWEQETLNAPNDPLIKRVRSKLANQIDYPDKPSRMGYPDGPTPQQVAGWHPEYGKRAAYYNGLDPQSADAMPATGDPETDQKVAAQKTLLKPVKQVYRKKGKPNS